MDSSFWILLRDGGAPDHGRILEVARRLLNERDELVITDLVLAETHAYFSRSTTHALKILDDFENNRAIHCEPWSRADQQEAFRLLRRHRDRSYSLCDAISFCVMRRLGIQKAASMDHHFRQIGEFELVC